MRIVLKGGVWKNSEDEILKAAIMKYGLNQWARVASLLPRKTAAVCKARWYEWLDPGIKKTEWTRDEEERLLHLAKLMPAQWRTIAPLVGRTAAQCIEHYERLLDSAQSKAAGGAAAGATGAGAGASSSSSSRRDDPRRLRPGEIDPMPELKPARPDPVDMDEDEKEMLSEARARIANTRGKKAKRKARERVLEEAKRLATLQKMRELKAAGIDTTKRRRKATGEIDYGKEIPFEKRAPAGFFDTAADDVRRASERAAESAEFKTTLLNKIEDERAADRDARERANDRKKMRKMATTDLPAVLLAEAEKDALNVRKRAKLALPAPTLTDGELEDIARIGAAAGASGYLLDDALETGSVATRGLLADLGVDGGDGASTTVRPDGTSLGLPPRRSAASAAPSREAILEEARNQAAMRHDQAPLLGGENVTLEAGTGYEGAAPVSRRAGGGGSGLGLPAPRGYSGGGGGEDGSTPLLHAGGASGSGGSVVWGGGGSSAGSVVAGSRLGGGAGSVRGSRGAMPPLIRDSMGLNRGDGGFDGDEGDDGGDLGESASFFGESASVRGGGASRLGGVASVLGGASTVRDLSARVALGLRGLPKPKYEVEVAVPDAVDTEGEGEGEDEEERERRAATTGTSAFVADAGEEAERMAEEARKEELRVLARRSGALRHQPPLPRPLVLDDDAVAPPVGAAAAADGPAARLLAIAEGMVHDEMLAMLKSDAATFPINHRFFKAPKRAVRLPDLTEEQAAESRALLEAEAVNVRIRAENSSSGGNGNGNGSDDASALDAAAYAAVWEETRATHVYLPSSRRLVARSAALADPTLRAEVVTGLAHTHELLAGAWARENARLDKLAARLTTLTAGLEARSAGLAGQLAAAATEAADKAAEVACFRRLASDEAEALPARLARAQAEAQEQADRERALQTRYAQLMREMDDLQEKLRA